MFVWRDFREDGKFRREKWRERSFNVCLVGRESGKKCGWTQVFFSRAHQNIFFPKWGENLEEKFTNMSCPKCPCTFFFANFFLSFSVTNLCTFTLFWVFFFCFISLFFFLFLLFLSLSSIVPFSLFFLSLLLICMFTLFWFFFWGGGGIITHNPPVIWAKITLPTCSLKSVT